MTLSNLWFISRWLNGLYDHAHVGQNMFSRVAYWQICSLMIVDIVQLIFSLIDKTRSYNLILKTTSIFWLFDISRQFICTFRLDKASGWIIYESRVDYPRPCHNITQVYCARVIWGSTCIKIFIHSQDWWRHMRLQSFNIPTFCYSINVALNKRMTSFGNWMLKTSSSFCPWTKIKPLWKYK